MVVYRKYETLWLVEKVDGEKVTNYAFLINHVATGEREHCPSLNNFDRNCYSLIKSDIFHIFFFESYPRIKYLE